MSPQLVLFFAWNWLAHAFVCRQSSLNQDGVLFTCMDSLFWAFCQKNPAGSAVESCGIYGIWKQAPKASQRQLQWCDLAPFFVLLEPPLYPSRQLPIGPGCPGVRHDLLRCWGPKLCIFPVPLGCILERNARCSTGFLSFLQRPSQEPKTLFF